jgi:aldose 1-epimerase
VRYTLDDDGTLTLAYEAITDAPTPLNLTSHPYFNLSGQAASDVRGHVVSIDAQAFFEVDGAMIPCRRAEVSGNAFDFRQSAPLGARLDWPNTQLALAQGFDHCYVLSEALEAAAGTRPVRQVARVYEPGSGRELRVLTDQWGLQFYTGNHLEGEKGRGGLVYSKYAGLCLEAGGFPDQINMADHTQVVLRPGEEYRQVTQYRVGVRTGV